MAGRARVAELDGLRGLAILPVLVFHLTATLRMPLWLAYFTQAGWLGVDLFFVLSGYLITGILVDTAGREDYYKRFITRRVCRIFPLYYAVLGIALCLDYGPWPIRWDGFRHFGGWWYTVFLGNFPVFHQNQWPTPAMTPMWSLQVEEQFYLTFPLLVAVLPRSVLRGLLTAALLIAPLVRLGLHIVMPTNIAGAYVLAPCRMDSLAMGALIAIAVRDFPQRLQARWIAPVTAAAGLGVVYICRVYGPTPWAVQMRIAGYSLADLFFAGLLILVIAQRRAGLLRIFQTRWLVWTGTISYGLYLLHGPANGVVRKVVPAFGISPDSVVESAIGLVAAFGAAWASAVFFERPILRLSDDRSLAR